jgi:glutamine amidotransferase PdxT
MWTETIGNVKINHYFLGDYKFSFMKMQVKKNNFIRNLEISDANLGTEELGYNKKLSVNFISPKLIEDKQQKEISKQNIAELKEFCKFVLKELE